MTKYTLGRVKGEQGDAGEWVKVTFTKGVLYYNDTLKLVQVFFEDTSFGNHTGWESTNRTIPSPYRPIQTVYCSCDNLATLAYINTSGAVYGVHTNSTKTGLKFSVMYPYDLPE